MGRDAVVQMTIFDKHAERNTNIAAKLHSQQNVLNIKRPISIDKY